MKRVASLDVAVDTVLDTCGQHIASFCCFLAIVIILLAE